jgi:hypothetical protein
MVVERVAGQVAGVRAALAGLQGPASISEVRVRGGDVDGGGAVTGVDLASMVPVSLTWRSDATLGT